jgi:addiction module RelE/StbE family toxin
MAASLTWTEQALDDAREVFDYVRDRNPSAANRILDAIDDACLGLREFPQSGRPYGILELRVISVRVYLVFYRYLPTDNLVEIVKVVDGRRDYGRLPGLSLDPAAKE